MSSQSLAPSVANRRTSGCAHSAPAVVPMSICTAGCPAPMRCRRWKMTTRTASPHSRTGKPGESASPGEVPFGRACTRAGVSGEVGEPNLWGPNANRVPRRVLCIALCFATSIRVRIRLRRPGHHNFCRSDDFSVRLARRRWTVPIEGSISRNPSRPRGRRCAQVAQLVEHVTENHGVGGSIPPLGTNEINSLTGLRAASAGQFFSIGAAPGAQN